MNTRTLEKAIMKAFHEACPERKVSRKPVRWWNGELEKLRKGLRRQFNRAMNTGREEDWKTHALLQSQYKKSVKKTKSEAWGKYCEELERVSDVSRLRKALEKDPQARLEVLKKPDGQFTSSKLQTLDLLIQTHFPDCDTTVLDGEEEVQTCPRPTWERWNEADETVTEGKVYWALSSFSPYKSPGPDGIFPFYSKRDGISLRNDWWRSTGAVWL